MYLSFASVQNEVLLALHRASYSSDQQEYFSGEEIKRSTGIAVGSVFLRKVLKSLCAEGQVEESEPDDLVPYFSLTPKGWATAEKLAEAFLQGRDPIEGVPASDRVVTLSDNQRNEIDNALSELQTAVQQSNEAGSLLLGEKDRVVAEVEAGRGLLKSSRVRLGALIGVLATPLRYLAEKFSGAAIGELAKRLLEEIWKAMNS